LDVVKTGFAAQNLIEKKDNYLFCYIGSMPAYLDIIIEVSRSYLSWHRKIYSLARRLRRA